MPATATNLRHFARWRLRLLPILLLVGFTLPHIDRGDWQRVDGAWYAAIAVQAWRTGELWTLAADPGQPYFNKPPLPFWIHGFVLHAAGVGPVTVRLASIAIATACVLLTVGIARTLSGPRAALAAGIVLALTYEFFRRTHEICLDHYQLLFVLAGVLQAARAAKAGRSASLILAGIPIGLALMTKPFVALLIFPILMLWIPCRRWMAACLAAAAIAVLVAAPWHLSMIALHDREFTHQYVFAEVVDRAAGATADRPGEPTAIHYYLLLLAQTWWPWLPVAVAATVDWTRRGIPPRDRRLIRLAAIWFLVWFVSLSLFAGKSPRYSQALYPPLAIICGVWIARSPMAWLRRPRRQFFHLPRGTATLLAVVAAGGVALQISGLRTHGPIDPQWPALFGWMRRHRGEPVWQGALLPTRGARLYLEFGAWPIPTRNRWGVRIAEPTEGAHLIYHARDGLSPGPNETIEFESGDLKVTRLGPGGWSPTAIEDPGER